MNIVASLSIGSECTLYALLSSIGYHSLRTEQLETSLSILAGEDVVVMMSKAEALMNLHLARRQVLLKIIMGAHCIPTCASEHVLYYTAAE